MPRYQVTLSGGNKPDTTFTIEANNSNEAATRANRFASYNGYTEVSYFGYEDEDGKVSTIWS